MPYVEESFGNIERTCIILPTQSKTAQKTTTKTTTKTLSKQAQVVLNAIIVNPSVTSVEIASELHMTTDGVKYHIKNFKKKG